MRAEDLERAPYIYFVVSPFFFKIGIDCGCHFLDDNANPPPARLTHRKAEL
jgi:hypothetical protein